MEKGKLKIVFTETRFMPTPWQIQHDGVLLAEGSGMKRFLEVAPEVVNVLNAFNQTEDARTLRDLLLAYVEDEG